MRWSLGCLLVVTLVVPLSADVRDLPLLDDRVVGFEVLLRHIRSANPEVDEIYLHALYDDYRDFCAAEGVSLVVAFAQMAHETDYLRFSGSVRAIQYNYAGLGATSVGHPGLTFPDMRTGVAAHVQHIKAYADDEPLSTPLVDPRFGLVQRGTALTVRALTRRWATDPHYGVKVLAHAARLLDW